MSNLHKQMNRYLREITGTVWERTWNNERFYWGITMFFYQIAFGITIRWGSSLIPMGFRLYIGPFKICFSIIKKEEQ